MSSPLEQILISDTVTFILSMGVSTLGFAVRWGKINEEVTELKSAVSKMVTKDEMTSIKESLAEIKGMFKLTLRE